MRITKEISLKEFKSEFERYGRGDQFSQEGFSLLFDYLGALADDLGEPLELDVISLCCEYTEYSVDEIREELSLSDEELTADELVDLLERNGFMYITSHNDTYILA
jgi:hypothetical protein